MNRLTEALNTLPIEKQKKFLENGWTVFRPQPNLICLQWIEWMIFAPT